MAIVHDMPEDKSWLSRVMTTDFCPWANRFVYWLKEPVGWFAAAAGASALIGLFLAPIGWPMAASLVAIIAIGMAWPWLAVRAVACSLRPEVDCVHEDQTCYLKLSVRNRVPLPIWGLAVEGFLDRSVEEDVDNLPTAALAYVRGASTCTYRFSIKPALRGRYPEGGATLACSFPFGIWTARRPMKDIAPITVWPKVFLVAGQNAMRGSSRAEVGDGNRSGRTGDFIGIREYQRGDSAKHVNWIATARSGALIVTERGGPQCPSLRVMVDVAGGTSREAIADRVRVAASVLTNLHNAAIPLRVCIGQRQFSVKPGREGFAQMMNALTDVPIDGDALAIEHAAPRGAAAIIISSDTLGNPVVCSIDPTVSHRMASERQYRTIDRRGDLASQLKTCWTEVRDANLVA